MRSRAIRTGLGLILVVGSVVLGPPLPGARAGGEAVPDLAMAQLDEIRIQWVNGRRLLRFTAMMVNVGAGQFELRGSRPSTSAPMAMSQVIYQTSSRTSPVSRQIPTAAVARYSGDGHNHWHVQEMMRYDLWGPEGTVRGAKVGFCFLDSDAYNLGLPGAVGSVHYRGSMCGTNPSQLSNQMGISIGWGDKYGWHLAYQWVDITGLPGGTYWVRAKVDPYGFFTEQDETNQCAYLRISWTNQSNAVTAHEQDLTCVTDWSTSPFASDIAWAYETGVTVGCVIDLFCTNNIVSREQMATFLVRSLALPPTANDYFTDDGASGHQDNINAVAEAGITVGCGGTNYCPLNGVTREQMASFLARAHALPAPAADHFTDDEASDHQDDINRIAEAGITLGCGGTRYCPGEFVTRGEMAAFLHRGALLP